MDFLSTNLIEAFINGFIISVSLIVSIGPQNTLVIRHGLARKSVIEVISTCIIADVILILIGVYGAAELFEQYHYASLILGVFGIAFLLYCCFNYLKSAITTNKSIDVKSNVTSSRKKAIVQALTFTFLNPAAIMETVVLIGGVSSQYDSATELNSYFFGAISASFVWFISIGIFTKILYPAFQKPISWKILDYFSAVIMLFVAYLLATDLTTKYNIF